MGCDWSSFTLCAGQLFRLQQHVWVYTGRRKWYIHLRLFISKYTVLARIITATVLRAHGDPHLFRPWRSAQDANTTWTSSHLVGRATSMNKDGDDGTVMLVAMGYFRRRVKLKIMTTAALSIAPLFNVAPGMMSRRSHVVWP